VKNTSGKASTQNGKLVTSMHLSVGQDRALQGFAER